MLFCRTVLLSLIGSVWCATTPVPNGHWLRGRTRGISKTVQPDDYPLPARVLRGEVENSTDWIGASSDSDGTETDDIAVETSAGGEFPPEKYTTTVFQTRGISKTVNSSDDHPTSVLEGEDLEVNNPTVTGSDSGGTKTDDMASEANTDETFPPKKLTTTLLQTEDEFRTRRGIVLVDDDFNLSPEPGVNQGWSDGTPVKSTKRSSTIDEGSGQEEPPSSTLSPPDSDGSGDDGNDPTEPWTNLCLNSTCDSRDLSVYPGHDEIVPVGTNLTLSCLQSNESVVELRWYKLDGDGNPLLQNTDSESELTFAIPKSRTEDSGRYVCLRVSSSAPGSCCHRTLHVKVYEVPNYRYHLIVIGVVAAVSLFACILIGMCRNYKTKKYEVQLELQNMESDCVYKM